MALIIADRVKETTTTTGTGNISLSGRTFGGFQTFAEAIGDGKVLIPPVQTALVETLYFKALITIIK